MRHDYQKTSLDLLRRLTALGAMLASPENRIPAVNVELRQAAEFSDSEIHEILRQAGFRSLLPKQPAEKSA